MQEFQNGQLKKHVQLDKTSKKMGVTPLSHNQILYDDEKKDQLFLPLMKSIFDKWFCLQNHINPAVSLATRTKLF